jgi:hypothetical protein
VIGVVLSFAGSGQRGLGALSIDVEVKIPVLFREVAD